MRRNPLIRRIVPFLCVAVALTLSIGCTSDSGNEATSTMPAANMVTSNGQTVEMVTTYEGSATSFTRRGNDPFSIGYYVKDGNIVAENSLLADQDAPASSFDLDICANGEAFDAVVAHGKGTDITLTGSITATDNGDGKLASDFSGLGAMIIAHDYAKVKINDMTINTKGFVRAAFISAQYGQILVKNTTIKAMGANPITDAYDGYHSSADQNMMLSPPWVLGIYGGIRGGNMLGQSATLSLIDSSISTGGWAVLSTDDCTAPVMNVVDSTMEILPESEGGMTSGNFSYSKNYGSGYGTYLIGSTVQNFYGVTFKGVTYAGIYTGGTGNYKSSKGKITLKDAEGKDIETVTGKGNPTTINAVWGFMTHGEATVNVTDGTVVNAEEAVFLHKAGSVSFNADNAKLNAKSGVLLQMIDNDDSLAGGPTSAGFNEKAGWPSENGSVTEPGAAASGGMGGNMEGGREGGMSGGDMGGREGGMPEGGMPGGDMGGREGGMPEGGMPGGDMGGREGGMSEGGMPGGDMGGREGGMPEGGMSGGEMGGPGGGGGMGGPSSAKLILTNGEYNGDVFNGSGYWGSSGNTLEVTVGNGATLTGAISLTETRHVDENGKQNTNFTFKEYYYLGHVENRNFRNETAEVSVALKDGGVWNVTGEGLLSSLQLDGGTITNAKMTVDGKETPIEDGKTYTGDIVISPAK